MSKLFLIVILTNMADYYSSWNVITTLSTLTRKFLFFIAKCQTISRNYAVVIQMFKIVNLFFGTIKKLQQRANLLLQKGIYFVQDLLNRDGKFLSLKNFQRKYDVQLNYLKYFQLIAAIPNYLKRKRNIFE